MGGTHPPVVLTELSSGDKSSYGSTYSWTLKAPLSSFLPTVASIGTSLQYHPLRRCYETFLRYYYILHQTATLAPTDELITAEILNWPGISNSRNIMTQFT